MVCLDLVGCVASDKVPATTLGQKAQRSVQRMLGGQDGEVTAGMISKPGVEPVDEGIVKDPGEAEPDKCGSTWARVIGRTRRRQQRSWP